MDRVTRGFYGEKAGRHDCLRNIVNLLCNVENWETLERNHAPLRGIEVAVGRLVENKLGNTEIVLRTLVIPPVAGDLLARGLAEIASGPCGQITRNRRFNVDTFGQTKVPSFLPHYTRAAPQLSPTHYSPLKLFANRLSDSPSICRTRSRVRPRISPISLSVFGSSLSKPKRSRRMVASRGSISSSMR